VGEHRHRDRVTQATVNVPRTTGPISVGVGAAWKTARSNPDDGIVLVFFRCPQGHVSFLRHAVSDAGDVTPSVVCPQAACDFHEIVRLDEWSP